MKKMKCMLLVALIASFANAQQGGGNFNLTISSDGKAIIQKLQLLNADGYNSTISKTNKEYVFSNAVNRYGIYTLSVEYIDAASKKTGGTTIQLCLKAGDTKLNFVGSTGKYNMTGTSAAS